MVTHIQTSPTEEPTISIQTATVNSRGTRGVHMSTLHSDTASYSQSVPQRRQSSSRAAAGPASWVKAHAEQLACSTAS
jgi:hypothetical protein